jgi:2,3-bisphosphoglycerate-independent phosphoglycerate mutase
MAAESGAGRIASVTGRGYTMDRSGAWDRTQAAFDAIVRGKGRPVRAPADAVEAARAEGLGDELTPPAVVVADDGRAVGPVSAGDLVTFVNFRGDRMRQLVESMAHRDFGAFARGPMPEFEVLTLTDYFLDPPVPCLFPQADASGGLADLLEAAGVSNVRIAESEKFQHVTFFFDGRDGLRRSTEEEVHVKSAKGIDYRKVPETNVQAVAEQAVRALRRPEVGFTLVNLANPDVVGHTGDLDATRRAVEAADRSLGQIVEAALDAGRWVAVVGDHGNAEEMLTAAGKPNVGHNTNPVPFVLASLGLDVSLRQGGSLADVAPTVAGLLGLDRGSRMEGEGLVRNSVMASKGLEV